VDFSFADRSEILQELGQRLRRQRLAQELTQQELAGMAGVAPGTIKKLESNGTSSLETVVRVVQALGLTDELQALFVLPSQSIAQMEQAEQARQIQRVRAPRRKRS
jgi:transcriptional regulator with XRE-family HTH domain